MISKLFTLIIHVIQMGEKLKEIPELFIPAVHFAWVYLSPSFFYRRGAVDDAKPGPAFLPCENQHLFKLGWLNNTEQNV